MAQPKTTCMITHRSSNDQICLNFKSNLEKLNCKPISFLVFHYHEPYVESFSSTGICVEETPSIVSASKTEIEDVLFPLNHQSSAQPEVVTGFNRSRLLSFHSFNNGLYSKAESRLA